MSLRIRQIVFAARDLSGAVARFERELGLRVCYRDPGVAKFGLENALLPLGQQFVEIVSPTQPDTAAGRHLARHGDSAYMLIFQTDDLARDRARIERLGVRIVWESHLPEISAMQLHPKDLGAAIVSLDEARPADSWHWAGPDWRRYVPDETLRIVSATIAARDPLAMARRWAAALGIGDPEESTNGWRLALEEAALHFVRTDGDADERIVGYSLAGSHGNRVLAHCGTEFAIASDPRVC
jgi:hypothetical protein